MVLSDAMVYYMVYCLLAACALCLQYIVVYGPFFSPSTKCFACNARTRLAFIMSLPFATYITIFVFSGMPCMTALSLTYLQLMAQINCLIFVCIWYIPTVLRLINDPDLLIISSESHSTMSDCVITSMLIAYNAVYDNKVTTSFSYENMIVPGDVIEPNTICAICHDVVDGVDHILTAKLSCSHVFHSTCMFKWIIASHPDSCCPTCRMHIPVNKD